MNNESWKLLKVQACHEKLNRAFKNDDEIFRRLLQFFPRIIFNVTIILIFLVGIHKRHRKKKVCMGVL